LRCYAGAPRRYGDNIGPKLGRRQSPHFSQRRGGPRDVSSQHLETCHSTNNNPYRKKEKLCPLSYGISLSGEIVATTCRSLTCSFRRPILDSPDQPSSSSCCDSDAGLAQRPSCLPPIGADLPARLVPEGRSNAARRYLAPTASRGANRTHAASTNPTMIKYRHGMASLHAVRNLNTCDKSWYSSKSNPINGVQ
jgi:hypothetical protein